jgi:hypothetical protein
VVLLLLTEETALQLQMLTHHAAQADVVRVRAPIPLAKRVTMTCLKTHGLVTSAWCVVEADDVGVGAEW